MPHIDNQFINILLEGRNEDQTIESFRGYVPDVLHQFIKTRVPDFEWKLKFLRWAALDEWGNRNPLPPADRKIRKIIKHMHDRYGYGADELPAMIHDGAFHVTPEIVEHIASFIDPGSINYIEKAKKIALTAGTVRKALSMIDEYAKESSPNVIREEDVNPEAEILIDFGDGFAWWNLGVASCKEEAKAGGHCGNSSRQNTNDTILSLREKRVDNKGNVYYKVHLTFILSYGGYLTEMKARFNEKPGPEYHKYIIPLLRHPIVKGIERGFYDVDNDFSIADLEKDTLYELLGEKPELWNNDIASCNNCYIPPNILDLVFSKEKNKKKDVLIHALKDYNLINVKDDGSIVLTPQAVNEFDNPSTRIEKILTGDESYYNDVSYEIEEEMRLALENILDRMDKEDVIEKILKPLADEEPSILRDLYVANTQEAIEQYENELITNDVLAKAILDIAEYEQDFVSQTVEMIYDMVYSKLFPLKKEIVDDILSDVDPAYKHVHREETIREWVFNAIVQHYEDEIMDTETGIIESRIEELLKSISG